VGDCNTCHDPHGTAYNYNMLTDNMAAGNYRLCFDCHGLAGGTASDNIARYYPVASAGLGAAASATVNTGHNIKTAGGYLAQYTGLPCYDCHVVHGSRNGNSQLKSDQRWSGLGDTRGNAANTRTFCFGCHVASDDAATAGTVENLQRQTAGANRLKLPTANPLVEHAGASTQSCGACHGARNAYNDNTYGPHNPASGLCDTCHEGQGTRSAVFGFNGSHLKHSDNTTYRLACKACHSWTRPTNPAVHNDNTSAVQNAQVAFDNEAMGWSTIQYATAINYEYRSMSVNPYGGAILTPGYAGGTDNGTDARQGSVHWKNGTCSSIWCHSNAMPVGGTNVFDTVNWGGTVTCGIDCHGNDGQSGRARIGDNAAVTKGSPVHYKHVAAIQCNNCHYYTLTGANNVITAYDNHVNGVKDVRFAPSIGGSYDNVNRTCNGTACHGTNPVPLPRWDNAATVTNCFSCHQGTEQLYKPQSNKSGPSPVDGTQYATRGHGLPSGSYANTANPAAHFDNLANDCYFCHSENASHAPSTDNVADPYRLNGGGQKPGSAIGSWADNTDALCLKCHGSAADRSGVTLAATVAINKLTHSKAVAGAMIGVWTITPWKCVDCHDPHGDANNAMIRSGVNAPTAIGDNTATGAGSNVKGTPNRTTGISAVVFTDNTGYAANSYAVPGAGSYGICEVCHVQTTAYSRSADNTAAHAMTGYCLACHNHDGGFKGLGGSNQEQFFDNSYRADNTSNYRDLSGHRIQSGTSAAGLYDGAQVNCYGCHGVSSSNRQANECLKCHFENRTSGTPAHPNGVFEWATPTAPATPLAGFTSGTIDANDTLCLACHGLAGGATGTALNAVAAPNILPTTTESWTGGSGHGATASLSGGFAGPPAYHCADCHKSTAFQAGGAVRDQVPGGVHGSINRKLVRHDNVAAGGQEYPHPSDTYYNSTNLRSARMDGYCASKCHRNLGNGQAKDDNVADHAWDLLGGESKVGNQTHPSDLTPLPGGPYRAPDNLPLSENLSGAPPAGAGNEVCVTCHNPHGGGNLVNKTGAALTGGAKQMMRRSFSDNASTICKECHL
jgi:predicted CxxxxCH...CXXCH cytochrome family protein